MHNNRGIFPLQIKGMVFLHHKSERIIPLILEAKELALILLKRVHN